MLIRRSSKSKKKVKRDRAKSISRRAGENLTFLPASPPLPLSLLDQRGRKRSEECSSSRREREGGGRGTLPMKGEKTGGRTEQDRASYG